MRPDRHFLHQKLVAFARQYGIKAAAREFGCSRNTVRKWLRRFIPGKPSSLAERSRRPNHCPHQTPSSVEGLVVRLRKQTGFGAERLKQEFQINCSVGAIARILRQRALVRPRKKKPATKKTTALGGELLEEAPLSFDRAKQLHCLAKGRERRTQQ
jgi:transposase-like protein